MEYALGRLKKLQKEQKRIIFKRQIIALSTDRLKYKSDARCWTNLHQQHHLGSTHQPSCRVGVQVGLQCSTGLSPAANKTQRG